jgi:(2Fe-2S) ferredoxin
LSAPRGDYVAGPPANAVVMKNPGEPLEVTRDKLGIGTYHRHVLLCSGPDCCDPAVGEAAWKALKSELKDRGLTLAAGPNACYRTRATCLRVCRHGPIAVVYPEGAWYHGLTADRIPLFVEQHLVRGEPVREWVFADNPLPNTTVGEPPRH